MIEYKIQSRKKFTMAELPSTTKTAGVCARQVIQIILT